MSYYNRQNKSTKVVNKDIQPTESQIQIAIVEWAATQTYKDRTLAYYLFHVPNGGRRSAREGNKLKKEGMHVGIPDLYMDIARGRYFGFRLELKRNTGGIVSKEQKERITVLKEEGYCAVICRGFDASVKAISDYMALKQGETMPE